MEHRLGEIKSRRTRRQIIGWIAVGLSTALSSLWAFWGIIENFHEGWYYPRLASNVGLMFAQYLSLTLILSTLALVAKRWPRVGGILHSTLAIGLVYFLKASYLTLVPLIASPLVLLGLFYWFGRPRPRTWAYALVLGLPFAIVIVVGAGPAYRVAGRIDDGNLEARLVEGNNVRLVWAPAGPGWPDDGVSWEEANTRCRYLTADGKTIADIPQNLWRLPTVNEPVRSMARHGRNSGGVWDVQLASASYQTTPDKEPPLWNTHSKVIYWWTATEVDDQAAYMIVYDGKVWPRRKKIHPGYLGFRAVRTAHVPA